MSRHTYRGTNPRYRLVVGLDTSLPSFFGQVEDLAYAIDGAIIDEHADMGSTPEEGLLLWIGGRKESLTHLPPLVAALAAYGPVPLDIQLQLLSEMDRVMPFSFTRFGKELTAICRQSPSAYLRLLPPAEEVLLLVNQDGWQMHPWRGEQTVAGLLFPKNPEATLERAVASFSADPKIVVRCGEYSFFKVLPIYAILAHGTALAGPVAFANATRGLTARQVGTIGEEVFFVEPALRDQVTKMWYAAWNTLAARGL